MVGCNSIIRTFSVSIRGGSLVRSAGWARDECDRASGRRDETGDRGLGVRFWALRARLNDDGVVDLASAATRGRSRRWVREGTAVSTPSRAGLGEDRLSRSCRFRRVS
eukprot:m.198312 g.198312  ORF g.198312 m.198312 type:complete len:108 (-) comp18741_c0_seq3:508-831(-)